MAASLTKNEQEAEQKAFEEARELNPELFKRDPMIDSPELLRWIGIENNDTDKPLGHIKYSPLDFIVEEIDVNGKIINAENSDNPVDLSAEGTTWHADLVKINSGTLEVRSELANSLAIPEDCVSFAGIKDRQAITAQRISLRGIDPSRPPEIATGENYFLKNIKRGNGAISVGDLKGNRFTITIRFTENLSFEVKRNIEEKLEIAKSEGFWNYFHFQRFGTPRLISHWLGLLMLKKEYEEAVKIFVTYQAARELPYFKAMRAKVSEIWGDWKNIIAIIEKFPYHFQHELAFLRFLSAHPKDFLGALHSAKDQIRLWFYSYDSFLFNRKLSELINSGTVPEFLPLPSSFNPLDREPYKKYLEADGLDLGMKNYKDFPFVRVASRSCKTIQPVDIHSWNFLEKTMVLSFSLPKGSYATAFLMDFLTVCSGLPSPEGISKEKIDARKILNIDPIDGTIAKFKPVFDKLEEYLKKGGEK